MASFVLSDSSQLTSDSQHLAVICELSHNTLNSQQFDMDALYATLSFSRSHAARHCHQGKAASAQGFLGTSYTVFHDVVHNDALSISTWKTMSALINFHASFMRSLRIPIVDMAETQQTMAPSREMAKPLHIQQLENALDVRPFLAYVEQIVNTPITDESSSDSDFESRLNEDELVKGSRIINGIKISKDERRSDRMRLFNLDSIKEDRYWLRDLLLSDSSESSEDEDGPVTEEEIHSMLRLHLRRKRYAEQYHHNPENYQYQYYSVGLLSNYDKFPDHQRSIIGNKKKKKDKKAEKRLKKMKKLSAKERRMMEENQDQDMDDFDFEEGLMNLKEEDETDGYLDISQNFGKGFKSKKKAQQAKNPEIMAMRRKKIWVMMSKKELGKLANALVVLSSTAEDGEIEVQRAKTNNHKEMLTSCKRVAQYCMKHWRQKAMQSQKNMKEILWRAKRLTREMQAYWKRYDRVERETRRRQEKEAEEQRKLDGELMEAKRQQRKLNFLITQTELYAHFMSRKLGGANPQEQLRILSQLEEEKIPRLAAIDDYNTEAMKLKAKKNVQDAFSADQSRTRQFAHGVAHQELAEDFKLTETSISTEEERPQPAIFRGKLKHYQLKGMNWLANLYDQGINGILADEMGLGKTVQSIAFLCHIAEKYDAWGPFLIISPASTLHNWQQEMARFVPDFKVVPYWGNPQDETQRVEVGGLGKGLRKVRWELQRISVEEQVIKGSGSTYHGGKTEALEEKNKVFRSFNNRNEETEEEYMESKKRAKCVVQEARKDWMQKRTEILARNVDGIKTSASTSNLKAHMDKIYRALSKLVAFPVLGQRPNFSTSGGGTSSSAAVLESDDFEERKILRQFWDQKDLHTREASFHVVITSYQLVITDFKYFNRIKWQYLILDEAQALKSTNRQVPTSFHEDLHFVGCVRWKLLLGFSCRNRLLLSGTPIQNSMAELWALLHFIMPTLFDSHDEFNEWFSKDIESHAENKTGIDEKHLSRLHMILKPFMLRRIKKDVENELSDKIEVMVYCPLTTRQKLLYSALKKKIRIEDLLYTYTGANQTSQSVTSSLMNLVMQFRKVCNHPELFERREAKSPLFLRCEQYCLPKLVYEEGLLSHSLPSKKHILENMLSVFFAENIHRSLQPSGKRKEVESCFSFTRFCSLSPLELQGLGVGGLVFVLLHAAHRTSISSLLRHRYQWWPAAEHRLSSLFLLPPLLPSSGLVFTVVAGRSVYTYTTHIHHPMPETLEHRILRSRKVQQMWKQSGQQLLSLVEGVTIKQEVEEPSETAVKTHNLVHKVLPPTSPSKSLRSPKVPESKSPSKSHHEEEGRFSILPEFPHKPQDSTVLELQPTDMPTFLHKHCFPREGQQTLLYGSPESASLYMARTRLFHPPVLGGLAASVPRFGWSNILVPDKQTLVTDAGKLYVLDGLLKRLKEQGHRVLIYSQMTRMIDLLEVSQL
uniref:Chromatin-remodeling ATPase INO80 n=1 Tax=Timema monikensis TaxID=170555 RepID=A0A7R9HQF4_9NEOP|nr:unnamed protein product [Timema monikensis]